MKYIKLKVGLFVIVDDEWYGVLSKYKWRIRGEISSSNRYASASIDGKSVLMHRIVIGAKDGEIVDHVNGDSLDNRKCNLRICTQSENLRNARKRTPSQSEYKGLSRAKGRNNWQVQICVDRKKINLGCFVSEIEAAKVYDAAARYYFGEFAATNFDGDVKLSAEEIRSRLVLEKLDIPCVDQQDQEWDKNNRKTIRKAITTCGIDKLRQIKAILDED